MKDHYDLIIVGGGMVGASLACLLALESSLRILIVESHPLPDASRSNLDYQPSFDARSTALSYGSRKIYQQIGIWSTLSKHVAAITKIHVSDAGHWGSSLLDAQDEGMDALGYVVENQWLGKVLLRHLHDLAGQVDFLCPARVADIKPQRDGVLADVIVGESQQSVSAQLAVIADGAESDMCKQLGINMHRRPALQHAIITNVLSAEAHKGVAYERFIPGGSMGMLPLPAVSAVTQALSKPTAVGVESSHRSALVWVMPKDKAAQIATLADKAFLRELQASFGYRLGRISQVGERFEYPVSIVEASEQVRSGIAVVGNAAHALHPVAGQGFNLALRDLGSLAQLLIERKRQGEPLGALNTLMQYHRQRQANQRLTMDFSQALPQIFNKQMGPVELARMAGLVALDLLPNAKTRFVEFATGIDGKEANLA